MRGEIGQARASRLRRFSSDPRTRYGPEWVGPLLVGCEFVLLFSGDDLDTDGSLEGGEGG